MLFLSFAPTPCVLRLSTASEHVTKVLTLMYFSALVRHQRCQRNFMTVTLTFSVNNLENVMMKLEKHSVTHYFSYFHNVYIVALKASHTEGAF